MKNKNAVPGILIALLAFVLLVAVILPGSIFRINYDLWIRGKEVWSDELASLEKSLQEQIASAAQREKDAQAVIANAQADIANAEQRVKAAEEAVMASAELRQKELQTAATQLKDDLQKKSKTWATEAKQTVDNSFTGGASSVKKALEDKISKWIASVTQDTEAVFVAMNETNNAVLVNANAATEG